MQYRQVTLASGSKRLVTFIPNENAVAKWKVTLPQTADPNEWWEILEVHGDPVEGPDIPDKAAVRKHRQNTGDALPK